MCGWVMQRFGTLGERQGGGSSPVYCVLWVVVIAERMKVGWNERALEVGLCISVISDT